MTAPALSADDFRLMCSGMRMLYADLFEYPFPITLGNAPPNAVERVERLASPLPRGGVTLVGKPLAIRTVSPSSSVHGG